MSSRISKALALIFLMYFLTHRLASCEPPENPDDHWHTWELFMLYLGLITLEFAQQVIVFL